MTSSLLPVCIFFTFLSCKSQAVKGVSQKENYIDSIRTASQINILVAKIDGRYKNFQASEILDLTDKYSGENFNHIGDSLNVQPWTKADFDNNGLTDILVVGNWERHAVLCILDKGGRYEIKRLTRRSFQNITFPVVEDNKISYYYYSRPNRLTPDTPRKLEQLTLIYKFGDFIEENSTPQKHEIATIEYSTFGSWETSPAFTMIVRSDRNAKWEDKKYNIVSGKNANARYTSTISTDKFEELIQLLNYIDFEKLEDSYALTATDQQSATLKITYNNGKIKTIRDYGLIGTFGLSRVHQLISALRENQKWLRELKLPSRP